MPEAGPPLAENFHPVGDSTESAVRLPDTIRLLWSYGASRRLSVRKLADSRGEFLAAAGGEMRSD